MKTVMTLFALIAIAAIYLLSGDRAPVESPDPVEREVAESTPEATVVRVEPEDDEARLVVRSRGSISGRVVDPTSRPIAGARVVFEPSRSFVHKDILVCPAGQASRFVDCAFVITADDGTFEIEAVERAQLVVTASGHIGVRVETPRTVGRVFEVGDVSLGIGAQFQGRVVGPDGVGIEGAAVFARTGDRPVLRRPRANVTRTGADGRFAIVVEAGEDEVVLVGEHPDHAPGEVLCPAPTLHQRLGGFVIRLAPSSSIEGTILGFEHHEGDEVLFVSAGAKLSGSRGTLRFVQHTASIEPTGRFEVRGLVPEIDYQLQVQAGDTRYRRSAVRGPAKQVPSGSKGVELELLPTVTLRFGVASESSESDPIRVVRALAALEYDGRYDRNGPMLMPRVREFTSDEHGVFEIRLRPCRRGMKLALGVTADGHGPSFRTDIEVPAHGVVDAGRIVLELQPSLRVWVTGPSDEPVEGALVSMHRSDYVPRSTNLQIRSAEDAVRSSLSVYEDSAGSRTDSDGRAVLTFDQAGRPCDVFVRHDRFAKAMVRGVTMPALGESRKVAVELSFGTAARIEVVDANGDPVGGVHVAGRRIDGGTSSWSHETDAAGIAVFDHLIEGRHVFVVTKARHHVQRASNLHREEDAHDDGSSQVVEVGNEPITVRLVRR